ncbi:MAG: hypothetical protein K6E84_04710 [Lachnospiraceae bacterium]|nr:hypothetical protein [Lachnospiraceae bacterium]
MQIGAVDLNLAMTRPQDIAIQKQNEDNKGNLDHAILQNTVDRKTEEKATTVKGADNTDTGQRQKDASDEGSNQYDGDGGARRRDRDEVPVEGRVVRKGVPHFEMKV